MVNKITIQQAIDVFKTIRRVYTPEVEQDRRTLVYNARTGGVTFLTREQLALLKKTSVQQYLVETGLLEVQFFNNLNNKRITQAEGSRHIYNYVNTLLNKDSKQHDLTDLTKIDRMIQPFVWINYDTQPSTYGFVLYLERDTVLKRVFQQNNISYNGYEIAEFARHYIWLLNQHNNDTQNYISKVSMDPEAGMYAAYSESKDSRVLLEFAKDLAGIIRSEEAIKRLLAEGYQPLNKI